MANATDAQVQQWSDGRARPFAESVRNLAAVSADNNGAIGSVYAACAEQSPTWSDTRTDVPNKLAPGDILALNTVSVRLAQILTGTVPSGQEAAAIADMAGQWAVVEKACVRAILG